MAEAGARPPCGSESRIWQRELKHLADFIGGLSARIVLTHDNPSLPNPVSECLARRFAVLGRLASCDAPREVATNPRLLALEQQVAAERPFMQVLDLTDRYCTSDLCSAVFDGVIGYRDRDHLSTAAVRKLAEPVQQAVLAALRDVR